MTTKQKDLRPILIIYFVLCFLFLIILSCCGYSTRSLLPSYMRNVHVKLFENRTYKPGLDELATNTVIDAFSNGSSLRIVDEGTADIVLEGKVEGFSKDPHTYTSDQNVIDYKITIAFSVRCIDVVRNEAFWEGSVSDWAIYAADSDEDEAINEAIKKTSERLVTTILTNW